MNAIGSVINQIDSLVWGWWMIILLLGTHIFMTIRTGVIQRKIGTAIRLSVTKDTNAEGEVSQFGALTTALASTIGTGNIIGVGTAIALGGPGAVLWCWLTGVFGIATKYSESLIAVKYRVKTKDGRMQGGAMYALERGLNMRWLGLIFAFFGGFASFGIGCATQVNAIATVCNENLHIPPAAIGIAVAVLTALVIFGGIKSIANVCERLVPFMAFFYVIGCIIILGINFDFIIPAVKTICKFAFTPGAAAGGLVGRGIMMAMQYGIARGLFSNESGMGSAPNAAATADVSHPAKQGLVQMLSVFIDTLLICTATALMCLCSGVLPTEEAAGAPYVQAALQSSLGNFGPIFIAVSMALFAFTTLIGNYYYCEGCLRFIFKRTPSHAFMTGFRLIAAVIVLLGAMLSMSLAWDTADLFQALMVIINIPVILILGNTAVKTLKDYMAQRKEGKDPHFKAASIGLKQETDYWN